MDNPSTTTSLRWRRAALWASAVCCVAIMVCRFLQPDWLAPVTLVPGWYWLVPAVVLTGYGFARTRKLWFVAVLVLWAIYTGLFVEEVQSLVRGARRPTDQWQAARHRGQAIRVVSLNCAGDPRSVAEVADYDPDVVILQESPGRAHVEDLAHDLFGDDGTFLWGGDTSILARGNVASRFADPTSHFVHAEVKLSSGLQVDVVSVRLSPPVSRLDFWTPGFWSDHRDKRIKHRLQVEDMMQQVEGNRSSAPLIVGGDFNAPPDDAALSQLRAHLVDTFRQAGRGWGNTGTNDYPLFRVDQIWVSQDLHAESVTAQKTKFSDHRMVICDLIVKK